MYLVFDLETTGLDSNVCEVIEFSYVMFDDDNMFIKAETLYFYHPGMHWSEEAYNVHHISREFLRQYEDDFKKNLIKMYTVLNLGKVCGHNALRFDCVFAKNWLERMGLPDLNFKQIEDTMVMFKSVTKKGRIKLTKLQELFEISDEAVNYMRDVWYHDGVTTDEMGAHNAEWDVTLTALLTLQGINKGFCSFNENVKQQVKESIDIDTLDFNETVVGLPDTFYVKLGDVVKAVNIKKNFVEEVDKDSVPYMQAVEDKQVIPFTFTKTSRFSESKVSTDNNTYYCNCSEYGITLYYIDEYHQPELYIISNGYTVAVDDNVNVPAFIKRTFC